MFVKITKECSEIVIKTMREADEGVHKFCKFLLLSFFVLQRLTRSYDLEESEAVPWTL